MTPPREPDDRDPLAAYAAGDPDAVRAAAPREPSEAEWDAARRGIHERMHLPRQPTPRRAVAFARAGAAALVAVAATVALAVFNISAPSKNPQAPEVAEVKHTPAAPAPHGARSDSLAEFDVLAMASAEEVILHRVPGDGWLPVGAHPLAGALSLASAAEVELDDPDEAWPNLTAAPGFAPMIFAAKPR